VASSFYVGAPAGKKHTVAHDEKAGTTSVSYLEWVDCGDARHVQELLARAARQRSVGATAANEHSSRSHMLFLLSVRASNPATGQQLNGRLFPRMLLHAHLQHLSLPALPAAWSSPRTTEVAGESGHVVWRQACST
jgi:hypothetical protein